MKSFGVCLLFLALLACSQAQDFHGKAYQKSSAQNKASLLSKALILNRTPGGYYSLEDMLAQLGLESMDTSFDTIADDMPTQFFGAEYRKKVIHSVAAHGFGVWQPVPNNLSLTGIFQSGCDNVLVRLSSAGKPAQLGNSTFNATAVPGALTPGLAMKFLRDNIPSANVFAIWSLGGQQSYNFFAHDASNHIPAIPNDSPLPAKIIQDKFATASNFPNMVGVSHLAEFDQNGNKVPSPVFPWRIIFHPATDLHTAFPDNYPNMPFYQQLSTEVKPGLLYQVFALLDPADDANLSSAVHIADFRLTTTLTTSDFGDSHLFFQHHRFENDIGYHSEWAAAAKAIIAQQAASANQVIYPDLPFHYR